MDTELTPKGHLGDLFEDVVRAEVTPELRERIEKARTFFYDLERLVKNATLYGFEHSSVDNLKRKLVENSVSFFERTTEVSVQIRPFEIIFKGHQVYEHRNLDQHYLFRLYQDGLRMLTLRSGVTERELLELCKILVLDLSEPEFFEDDLITLIWSSNLPNIDVHVREVRESAARPEEGESHWLSDAISDTCSKQIGHPNNARYRGVDLRRVSIGRRDLSQCGAHTTNLGTEQAQKLERLFKSNERERFEKFVEILFQLHIQFSSDDLGRGERIAVLFDRIADLMLDQGHYGELERLICKLRTLHKLDHKDAEETRQSIEYLLQHWSQEVFVAQILKPAYGTDQPVLNSMLGILSKLNTRATPAMAQHTIQLTDPRLRERLWAIIGRQVRGYEIQLARLLVGALLPVARELIQVLIQNGDATVVAKGLMNALRNGESAVRLEALVAAEKLSPDLAEPLLLRALSDGDSSVRGKALHLLARRRAVAAVDAVDQLIRSDRFTDFSLEEKRRLCVTYALVGGGLDEWVKRLNARTLIESNENLELKHAYLVALGVCLHSDAAELSEKLLSRKRKVMLTDAAMWVRQHLECDREERTRQLYAIFYSGRLIVRRLDAQT